MFTSLYRNFFKCTVVLKKYILKVPIVKNDNKLLKKLLLYIIKFSLLIPLKIQKAKIDTL
jgi:hypothetical protein